MKGNLATLVEQAALELVHRHSLDEIEAILVQSGVSPSDALRLVLLIPSAFAREHFEPQGIGFSETFYVGEKGNYETRAYADEPIYEEARQLARHWIAESRQSLIMRVLDWSAEANALEEAKKQGKTPTRFSILHHGF